MRRINDNGTLLFSKHRVENPAGASWRGPVRSSREESREVKARSWILRRGQVWRFLPLPLAFCLLGGAVYTTAGGAAMSKRASGFGKPRWKREPEPREIGPSSAAPEPSGTAPDPVFRDNNEPAGDWQSSPAWGQSSGGRRRQGENVRMPSEYLPRLSLTDEQWQSVKPFLIVKKKRGRKAKNLRKTFEGILWVFRTGAPWRDLPGYFGKWNSVYQAFRRMCKRGAFLLMFMSLAKELDLKLVMVDGSFVKVHQHAVGARRGELTPEESRVAQAIGKTKGGLNTNLLALADKNGKLAVSPCFPATHSRPTILNHSWRDLTCLRLKNCSGTKPTIRTPSVRCWPRWGLR